MVCIPFIQTNLKKVKDRYIFGKDDLSTSNGLRIVYAGFTPLNQYLFIKKDIHGLHHFYSDGFKKGKRTINFCKR
jgi:hypothetical protein